MLWVVGFINMSLEWNIPLGEQLSVLCQWPVLSSLSNHCKEGEEAKAMYNEFAHMCSLAFMLLELITQQLES